MFQSVRFGSKCSPAIYFYAEFNGHLPVPQATSAFTQDCTMERRWFAGLPVMLWEEGCCGGVGTRWKDDKHLTYCDTG